MLSFECLYSARQFFWKPDIILIAKRVVWRIAGLAKKTKVAAKYARVVAPIEMLIPIVTEATDDLSRPVNRSVVANKQPPGSVGLLFYAPKLLADKIFAVIGG
jgi:hypothetical protein